MSDHAILLSGMAALCWGAGAIFDKLAVRNLDPDTAFFVRFYLLFLIIMPFLVRGWGDHKAAMLAAPRMAPMYLLGSVVLYAVGMYVYYHALGRAEAGMVVPLSSTYPLITFLLALFLLAEPFTWQKLAGASLIVAGSVVLVR